MFKSLVCFVLLNIVLFNFSGFASTPDSRDLAAVVTGKGIYGKGIHDKCLPYALGLAQVLRDRFKMASVGIVYTWSVAGSPTRVGQHIAVQYTTVESGVTKRWITDNETKFPILVTGENAAAWISAFHYNGTFTVDRILQLPLTSLSDREYVGGALMAGALNR